MAAGWDERRGAGGEGRRAESRAGKLEGGGRGGCTQGAAALCAWKGVWGADSLSQPGTRSGSNIGQNLAGQIPVRKLVVQPWGPHCRLSRTPPRAASGRTQWVAAPLARALSAEISESPHLRMLASSRKTINTKTEADTSYGVSFRSP